MICTHAVLTGPLFLYILSSKLFLCYPSPVPTFSHYEIEGPKITELWHMPKEKCYTITCIVEPGLLNDETLVYWLANDQFIKDAFRDHRVITRENRSDYGSGNIQTDLVFKERRQEDNFITFTCIALNSAGNDMRSTTLHGPY